MSIAPTREQMELEVSGAVLSWERDKLGRFGSPVELLLIQESIIRWSRLRKNMDSASKHMSQSELMGDTGARIFAGLEDIDYELSLANANLKAMTAGTKDLKSFSLAEVHFWRGGGVNFSPTVHTHFERIGKIYSSPEDYYDYFAVGLWDLNIIYRAIKEGIDPQLALSLSLP